MAAADITIDTAISIATLNCDSSPLEALETQWLSFVFGAPEVDNNPPPDQQ